MRGWHRLQAQVALTRSEAGVLLVVMALLAGGAVVRALERRPPPPEVDARAELERLLRADSAAARASAPPVAVAARSDTARLRLDLNAASAADLERLPRIGPALAGRIVAYRRDHGPFRSVAELDRVKGIGEKTLARLEPHLYVGHP